jgi:hypothetical protein
MYYSHEQGGDPFYRRVTKMWEAYKMKRGMVFGAIIIGALLAFELFNYTTTDFALTDLLGDLQFLGIRWSVILALAFCAMDFAGIARLFTPEKEGRGEHLEVWYLVAAWFLAATMNAMLTWWGVSLALLDRAALGNEILGRDQLLTAVPIFVAVLVWLIRILIIGTFSMAGDRLFSQAEDTVRTTRSQARSYAQPTPLIRPNPKSPARPVRMIGEVDEERYDDFDQRPPQPVESVRRPSAPPAQPVRPSVPPVSVVRPAPKPSANPQAYPGNNSSGNSVRPAVQRNPEGFGRSNNGGDHN